MTSFLAPPPMRALPVALAQAIVRATPERQLLLARLYLHLSPEQQHACADELRRARLEDRP